jgi:hypothetical protein
MSNTILVSLTFLALWSQEKVSEVLVKQEVTKNRKIQRVYLTPS